VAKEKNYVSVWFWLFAIILTAFPCPGIVFALFLAFTGENESRKNFFRAYLLIWTVFFILMLAFPVTEIAKAALKYFQETTPPWLTGN
jgi:hypothetical protein